MRRGEIRWYMFAAPDKRRPVLLLTRDDVIDVETISAKRGLSIAGSAKKRGLATTAV